MPSDPNDPPQIRPSPINGQVPPVEHQFQPGQSGNPGGRPSRKRITEAYERLMDMDPSVRKKYVPRNGEEEMAKGMLKLGPNSVLAAKEITDRVEGKAVETLSLQGNLGQLAAIASRRGDDDGDEK